MYIEPHNKTSMLQEFLPLAIAHLIAVASPGPDFAVVTKNTINYGKKYGRITALGVGIAILLHVTYAILGFSLIVKSNPTLFSIIKYGGAAFLLYLGVMSLKSKPSTLSQNTVTEQRITSAKAFRQGFFTNALNVKAMLFFLFLFTSIVDTDTGINTKIIYGVWLSGFTYAWFYGIASFIGWKPVRDFFLNWGNTFDKVMGIILIILAFVLIIK